jgi:hypothetical protein
MTATLIVLMYLFINIKNILIDSTNCYWKILFFKKLFTETNEVQVFASMPHTHLKGFHLKFFFLLS